MDAKPLPFDAALADYEKQAEELLEGHAAADEGALHFIHEHHPRFLDDEIKWLPKRLGPDDIRQAAFNLDDARLVVARGYDFADWAALTEYVEAVTKPGSPVHLFESAVEAVIHGDLENLRKMLREHPELVKMRSTRRVCFDPDRHNATLLHYIAANGVEGYRQKTPTNAVAIARALLDAGADPGALANMYGGEYATMSMLVSSGHPAKAGVQSALVDTLVDYGAAVEATGSEKWGSPLMTALAFGYLEAAETLVRRGARVDNVATAAGLGRVDDTERLLPGSDAADRHRAMALASQSGHTAVVKLLLDAGEDPSRYNPDGTHAHSTPLHQAALNGHGEMVRLLVDRGARLDLKDKIYQSTPLGWAEYGGQQEIAAYLRERGAVA